MALKNPRHKIQSSLAAFEFSNIDIIHIWNNFNWDLSHFPSGAIIKKGTHIPQFLEATRLCVLSFHTEVMKEALIEYKGNFKDEFNYEHKEYLEMIIDYIRLLRNACLHAKKKLEPRWDEDPKKSTSELEQLTQNLESAKSKQKSFKKINELEQILRVEKLKNKGLFINIPCSNKPGGYQFNGKSKYFKKIHFKVNPGKKITLNKNFIGKIRLLSYHILEITKKQKLPTLSKYLNHTLNIKSKNLLKKNTHNKCKVTP